MKKFKRPFALVDKSIRNLRGIVKKPLSRRIFFLHIAKCGGISLSHALRSCYDRFPDSRKFGLDSESALYGAKLSNQSYFRFTEQILLYLMGSKNMTYINGHFHFSPTAHREFGAEWDFITVLRHPVSRWFSQYFFNRYKKGDYFKTDLDLMPYLESKEGQSSGRTLIASLAPYAYDEADPTECTKEAIANLHKFALVGFTEHLGDFTAQFKGRYGRSLQIDAFNKSPVSDAVREKMITPEISSKVEEICRYDLEVYRYALKELYK